MESRFAHLRQRDTSVSMLRVKMSRRRSQSQKENRERTVNTRRQLDKLQELEMSSLDATMATANMSTIQEKPHNHAKLQAGEDRKKQLERWRERKALEKEKEKRERERKGVFKTGLYHPKDTLSVDSLPVCPAASTRAKEKKVATETFQSARVTRSMKQQPVKMQDPKTGTKKAQPAVERSTRTRVASVKPAPATTKTKVCAVEPVVRALSTRSANRPPVLAAPPSRDKPKDRAADVRTTRSRAIVKPLAPPSGKEQKFEETVQPAVAKEQSKVQEEMPPPPIPSSVPEEEDMVVDPAPQDPAPPVGPAEPASSPTSFAPTGFMFQVPAGLSNFKFEPLTPRSADAFLTPSSSFNLPPHPVGFSDDFRDERSKVSPPKSPHSSPPRTCPTEALPAPGSPLESKHDVPHFRSEIANETNRLTTLSLLWESKVEDESIPEEMRDRMRTAVGQARLLMKERFKQFSGLVDDCELGRGEKVTTCSDLQGFWDMVYYQVEDVNKKFDALKEAEGRGWVEEHRPPPRQRKVVKKPSAAPVKPAGTKAAAAKSRLAAAKAAMKAKQQAAEAEKAAKDAGRAEENFTPNSEEPQTGAQLLNTVVFDGGFFQVESPAKPSGSVRRSSHLSAAVLPPASPCSTYLSPRRVTRRSLALAQTAAQVHASPAKLRVVLDQTPAPKSQSGTPQPPQHRQDAASASLCYSPVKEALPDDTQSEESSAMQSEQVDTQEDAASVPELSASVLMLPTITVAEEQAEPAQTADVDLHRSPRISISPCKTPPPVPEAAEPSSSLSFTVSPCGTPSQPPPSSPAVQDMEVQQAECNSPDSSVVEEIPGLDFERYFQPSQRCSVSPRDTVAETSSPMAVEVEMESPRGQHDDPPAQQETALPEVSSALTLQSPQVQTAESAMLLFTPDLKDRIRQSVCPSDLMVFTPPNM